MPIWAWGILVGVLLALGVAENKTGGAITRGLDVAQRVVFRLVAALIWFTLAAACFVVAYYWWQG